VIVDASFVIAALTEKSLDGEWARGLIRGGRLAAPQLLPAEVVQVFRRQVARGLTSGVEASQGLEALVDLRAELHAFEPFADRVWELRDTVSAYDAWYVALAEALDVPFATLDTRLARAPGPRCAFLVPDVGGPA
jgi:predicted nucleic acid-binding protein